MNETNTELQENKKRGKLRDTFIVLFILISCVPILGLGSISLISITNAHKMNVSELEHQTLISTQEITSLFFKNIIDTLATNFDTLDDVALQSATTTSWQHVYAKKFVEDNPAFLEVSFVNLQGKEVAKYSKVNTSNTLLYLSELPIFKQAVRGKVAMSDIHQTMHGQSITIAVPSVVNGTVFNVVIAEVTLSPLITSIETVRLGKTGRVFLFDSKGVLVGSKDGSTNHAVLFSSWERLQKILKGESSDGLSTSDRYESPLLDAHVIGSSLLVKDISWPLLVEWPTIESDILVDQFRTTVLITIFLCFIMVLIVASILAHYLVKPIRTLQEAANQIKEGNFEKEVIITTDNELEELGESFNTMSKGLKRLEELKNEFVYVAAHELRAPVTAIKGYLELVFDGDAGALTPELEHLLTPVKRSNERLVNLVNDLLKVARSEAGKLEIALSPSNIRTEVNAILDEIRPLALKRNMTVIYNPPEILPLVMVNTGSFKEVIMNFASNAVKYGNDNGTITVTHIITNTTVATSIADNGRGMSEEDQKHLFEKFFRAGDVKKTTIEGTGLGLFITKELVEKMGGTLAVSSTLDIGTTFTVSFPIAKEITPTPISS